MQQQLASDQILPSRHQQALEQQGLGTPSNIFYKNNFSGLALFWTTIGLLVVYAFAMFMTIVPVLGSGDGGPTFIFFTWSDNLVIDVLQVIWTMLLVLILLGRVLAFVNRHYYLCIYPQELVVCTDQKIERFALEGIELFWRGWSTQSENAPPEVHLDTASLRLNDGRAFEFSRSWGKDNQAQRMTICDTIERDFVRRRLPSLIERYDSSNLIDFPLFPYPGKSTSGRTDLKLPNGSLSISRTTISNGEEVLSWDEIESFQVGEDVIKIRKRGKVLDWYNCLVPNMPNACLLRELARQRELLR